VRRRLVVIGVSVSLLATVMLTGAAPAQADHNPLHSVVCLVRAVPVLPPPGCKRNSPPTAVLEAKVGPGGEYTTDDVSGCFIPLAFFFRGTNSTDPDNNIATWSIDFGDGASTGTQSWTTNPPDDVLHLYFPGQHTAVLTVTDAAGASDTDSSVVTVCPT
jgi:hypothetical protein